MKFFVIPFILLMGFNVTAAQDKIYLYEDTAMMKKEILTHIPIGSSIETAGEISKKINLAAPG